MSKYIGITIGPIFNTIIEASKPASLWYASTLFSDLTYRICKGLSERFDDVKIYSPYFKKELDLCDGVGKYHDRIIFSTDKFNNVEFDEFIKEVKRDTASKLPKGYEGEEYRIFMEKYLQIKYVVCNEIDIIGNCVKTLSYPLDLLELMQTFPTDSINNPIKKIFYNDNVNQLIKESVLFENVKSNDQFMKNNKIRSIEEISSCNRKGSNKILKQYNYYAIVSADGDRVGKLINDLDNDKISAFSQACLEYNKEASKCIGEFGGMTIYAGGDDLLFIAPLYKDEKSIFKLCIELKELFLSKLEMYLGKEHLATFNPSVSFGIAVRYIKYPLYEALAVSRDLLKKAKKIDDDKDKILYNLQKHSGQSIELIISNSYIDTIDQFINNCYDDSNQLQSVVYTLMKFRSSFETLLTKRSAGISIDEFIKIVDNFFDNDGQNDFKDNIHRIFDFYYQYIMYNKSKLRTNDNIPIESFIMLLRHIKFLKEEGEEA